MRKKLQNLWNLRELFREHGVADLDFVSVGIGYDGKAYFLFSSRIPPRINGMFVNTEANAEYTGLILTPSWESGALEQVERIEFGRHRMNFRFLRPIPDGSFLLLGSRCLYSKKEGPEKNAVFLDRNGKVLREFCYGDGIADCVVRGDGTVVTSYFDEGVLGNYGWSDPIGSSGLCAWDADGQIIWRPERDILDCYAVNLDEQGNLWYYYYTDFLLVRTDFKTETEFEPEAEGASLFSVAGHGRFLIMSGGYDEEDSFTVSRIEDGTLKDPEPLEFVGEDGSPLPAVPWVFSGAKALIRTADGKVCCADFSAVD